jgi:hypothetical protein
MTPTFKIEPSSQIAILVGHPNKTKEGSTWNAIRYPAQ